MSSIRWHFEDVTLCMGGRERAWMGCLIRNIAEAVVSLRTDNPREYWTQDLNSFDLQIATAWALGSRPLRLAALIHGWCETNRLIESAAFAEIADALEEGLASGIFRRETQGYQGIDAIIARLRQGGDWCVWSYSVTDGFPRWSDEADDYMSESDSVAQIREEGNVIEPGIFECEPHTETALTLDEPLLRQAVA